LKKDKFFFGKIQKMINWKEQTIWKTGIWRFDSKKQISKVSLTQIYILDYFPYIVNISITKTKHEKTTK